jgi:hypothetical protein
MKQFLIDLTDIKANPMSVELQYEVGDIISMEVNCDIFGRYVVYKKVVKITENKYHSYRFIFVEENKPKKYNKKVKNNGFLSIKDLMENKKKYNNEIRPNNITSSSKQP